MTPGPYILTGTLREDAAEGLYRGVSRPDGEQVLVKVVRAERPVPREAERLRHEYEILRQLDGPCVPTAQSLGKRVD